MITRRTVIGQTGLPDVAWICLLTSPDDVTTRRVWLQNVTGISDHEPGVMSLAVGLVHYTGTNRQGQESDVCPRELSGHPFQSFSRKLRPWAREQNLQR